MAFDEQASAIHTRMEGIHANDPAVLHLGIELLDAREGAVTMSMPVANFMANSHGICHGGYLFTVADSALAYCCATIGGPVVTRNADITFIAPAFSGQIVTATAVQRVAFGRNHLCDVVLQAEGTVVAYFTGQGSVPTRAAAGSGR